MNLDVVPEGLAAASAQAGALVTRLIAHNAVHAAAGSAVLPPGSDPVSVKTAAALLAGNTEHTVMAMMGNEEMGRSSMGVAESSTSYALGDNLGAAGFVAVATV